MTKPLNVNEPVQVDNGRIKFPARIICTDKKGPRPIVVLYKDENGSGTEYEYEMSFMSDGTSHDQGPRLINVPKRIQGWVNVYPGLMHETKESAEAVMGSLGGVFRVACIYVDFAEDEGL